MFGSGCGRDRSAPVLQMHWQELESRSCHHAAPSAGGRFTLPHAPLPCLACPQTERHPDDPYTEAEKKSKTNRVRCHDGYLRGIGCCISSCMSSCTRSTAWMLASFAVESTQSSQRHPSPVVHPRHPSPVVHPRHPSPVVHPRHLCTPTCLVFAAGHLVASRLRFWRNGSWIRRCFAPSRANNLASGLVNGPVQVLAPLRLVSLTLQGAKARFVHAATTTTHAVVSPHTHTRQTLDKGLGGERRRCRCIRFVMLRKTIIPGFCVSTYVMLFILCAMQLSQALARHGIESTVVDPHVPSVLANATLACCSKRNMTMLVILPARVCTPRTQGTHAKGLSNNHTFGWIKTRRQFVWDVIVLLLYLKFIVGDVSPCSLWFL